MSSNNIPFEKFKIRIDQNDPCFCKSGKVYGNCCSVKFNDEANSSLEYKYWAYYIFRKQCLSRISSQTHEYMYGNPIIKKRIKSIWKSPLTNKHENLLIKNDNATFVYFNRKVSLALLLLILNSKNTEPGKSITEKIEPNLLSLDSVFIQNMTKNILGFFTILTKKDDGISLEIQDIYTGHIHILVDYFLWHECDVNFLFSAMLFPFTEGLYCAEFVSAYFVHKTYESIIKRFIERTKQRTNTGDNVADIDDILYKELCLCIWIEMVQAVRILQMSIDKKNNKGL